LKEYIDKNIIKEYKVEDFDIENPEHIKVYGKEIKQFVISRNGHYNEDILNTMIEAKSKDIEELISNLDKKSLFNMFNDYLKYNDEDNIDYETFLNLVNGGKVEDYISEYYEYFLYDYEPNIRADYAKNKLSSLNINLSEKALDELAQYVNDEQVPVEGGNNVLEVRVTGIPVLTNKVNDMVFDNQKESMLLAYAMVFILFAIQMHSIILGLLALIPITLTIIVNFGIMGLTGISLNAATVTITSITIGTGIDYTIHYLSRFKKEYRENKDKFKAAVRTSATSGRAILINSLAVILGFATFIFSEIGMLKQFGILTATAMIVAPFLTLTIFPVLMTMLSDKLLTKFSKESV
jgi:predicted RND superfamily exporter protein